MKASEIRFQKDMEKTSEYLGSKIIREGRFQGNTIKNVECINIESEAFIYIQGEKTYTVKTDNLQQALGLLNHWTTEPYEHAKIDMLLF